MELSEQPARNRQWVERLVAPLTLLDFDGVAATTYGVLRAALQRAGTLIGPNDMMIAATVVSRRAILVSANTRDFRRVPGLQVEAWSGSTP